MAKTVKGKKDENIIEHNKHFIDKVIVFFVGCEKLVGGFFRALETVFCNLRYCVFCEILLAVQGGHRLFVGIKKRVQSYRLAYLEDDPQKYREHKKKKRISRRRIYVLKKKAVEKEKALASRMIHLVNHVDQNNEKIAGKTVDIATSGHKKFNFAREWAELNKKDLIVKLGLIIIIVIMGVATVNHFTAYEYFYNGRLLGTVKRQEDVIKITSIVSEQLSKEHGAKVEINPLRDISFNRIVSRSIHLDDTEEVLKKLTYMRNINVEAYAIYIDDKRVSTVDNKAHAKEILDYVMELYTQKIANVTYEKIDFKEKVKIEMVDTKLGALEDKDEIINKLLTGATKSKIHTVVAGESLSIIAKAYGLTLKELMEANPTLDPTKLPIGQQLTVTKSAPMLTISTVEVTTFMAPIPYEVVKQPDANRYQGEKIVKVAGANGSRRVTARITRENGVQVASTELESVIEVNPVTEIIVEGTKKRPPTVGTGVLKYPLSSFTISSKYGPRWGGFHTGVDLAAPTGTRISAADGGTVIYAGYNGAYGNTIRIDHGGGVVTVYAHCSVINVKRGDKVYQGQQIGKVGSTGNSTGPHCHFEVRIRGKHKNPLAYV